jgi:hypothetical protein
LHRPIEEQAHRISSSTDDDTEQQQQPDAAGVSVASHSNASVPPAAQSAAAPAHSDIIAPAAAPAAEAPHASASASSAVAAAAAAFCSAGEPCTVCHEEFVAGGQVVALPCRHCFHEACLLPWLGEVSICCCHNTFVTVCNLG